MLARFREHLPKIKATGFIIIRPSIFIRLWCSSPSFFIILKHGADSVSGGRSHSYPCTDQRGCSSILGTIMPSAEQMNRHAFTHVAQFIPFCDTLNSECLVFYYTSTKFVVFSRSLLDMPSMRGSERESFFLNQHANRDFSAWFSFLLDFQRKLKLELWFESNGFGLNNCYVLCIVFVLL